MTAATVSIGVAGALGPAAIARIAAEVEAAGFHALWVNDTPGADSLAALAAAAGTTERLGLATGVVPVDRRPVAEVVAAAAAIPSDRLTLGIGSGAARTGALALVADAVPRLREATGARILVGALGPRMRRLAATVADGALLSWLTPEVAAAQAAEARAEAPGARSVLYVRTALEPAAAGRLAKETALYGSFPAYAANLERLGIDGPRTTLDDARFETGLAAYRDAVDEVVLRAITPTGDADSIVAFVRAAAARLPAA